MFKVIGKQSLSESIKRIDIQADGLVARMRPGCFVLLQVTPQIPAAAFNVYDIDHRRHCISIVFEVRDVLSSALAELSLNAPIHSLLGPLGQGAQAPVKGTYVLVAEDIGIASVVAIGRLFKAQGSKVIAVAGFSSRKTAILENQMRLNCSKYHVMYRDGAFDRKGDIQKPLEQTLKDEGRIQAVFAHVSSASVKDVYFAAWSAGVPLFINIIDLIEHRPGYHAFTPILLKDQTFVPGVEGIFVDSQRLDISEFISQSQGFKEYFQCRSKRPASSIPADVFARLLRFGKG